MYEYSVGRNCTNHAGPLFVQTYALFVVQSKTVKTKFVDFTLNNRDESLKTLGPTMKSKIEIEADEFRRKMIKVESTKGLVKGMYVQITNKPNSVEKVDHENNVITLSFSVHLERGEELIFTLGKCDDIEPSDPDGNRLVLLTDTDHVPYEKMCDCNMRFALLTEYVEHSRTLEKYLTDEPYDIKWTTKMLLTIYKQLAKMFPYFVHNDLNLSNVLIDAQGNPRIIDYGRSYFQSRANSSDNIYRQFRSLKKCNSTESGFEEVWNHGQQQQPFMKGCLRKKRSIITRKIWKTKTNSNSCRNHKNETDSRDNVDLLLLTQVQEALKLKPDDDLELVLNKINNIHALEWKPNDKETINNIHEAEALKLKPNDKETINNIHEAKALELKPDDKETINNIHKAEALELKPDDKETINNIHKAEALELKPDDKETINNIHEAVIFLAKLDFMLAEQSRSVRSAPSAPSAQQSTPQSSHSVKQSTPQSSHSVKQSVTTTQNSVQQSVTTAPKMKSITLRSGYPLLDTLEKVRNGGRRKQTQRRR